MITEMKYSNTTTYLIRGRQGYLLFDTGWAGSFSRFCKALKETGVSGKEIKYLLISHFHPDHCGIAQEIANAFGTKIVTMDVQNGYWHLSDEIFRKEGRREFVPVDDAEVLVIPIPESRKFLRDGGWDGEIFHTPGHSDDSISLWLDDGSLFVGDLNPLYELELHGGTMIGESWKQLLALEPCKVYYGHAKTAVLREAGARLETGRAAGGKPLADKASDGNPETVGKMTAGGREETYALVKAIMKYVDKGWHLDRIREKTGADKTFTEDVTRMYLTHPGVTVQGILDRIEIKNK